MTAVATTIWASEVMICMPPCWRNWLTVSMSVVTRAVREPRRSDCWCSIDRSWMWRKVRLRRFASAVSVTMNSRLFIR